MLRDVPHCRSILACGMGGLILSVVFLTLVYPAFCNKVTQVKEAKVREYMEDRYGIYDRSASSFRLNPDANRELHKAVRQDAGAAEPDYVDAGATGTASKIERDDRPDSSGPGGALPPAKRR